MGSALWAGFVAFFLVSLAVGARLLALWRRTRQLPELLIGVGILGIGPLGYGLAVAGQVAGSRPALASWLLGGGLAALSLGALAKFVFNWRVYHASSRSLGGVVAVVALAFAALLVVDFRDGRFLHAADPGPSVLIRYGLLCACLLWGSAEALYWWRRMRRRATLGLGDAVVANRFLLWGIGAGAAGVGATVGTLAQAFTGLSSLELPWVMASSSLHGLVAASALWLAFLPPAAYRRWLAARAA